MSHSGYRKLCVVLALALGLWGQIRPAAARDLRIKRVALSGVHTAPRRALHQAWARLLPRGRLSDARRRKAAADVRQALERTLRAMGYLRAAVRVTEHRPGTHTSFVVLRAWVREGRRHRIGALDVAGLGPTLRLKALSAVRLRSGQYFDAADLLKSSDAVATVLADRGHAFVRVTVGKTPHKRQALLDVIFRVKPGPVVKVGRVVVKGASFTGARLVRRALLLRRGSVYHRTTLRRALRRLRRTGAFERIGLQERPLGKRRVQLTVTVIEKKR